VTLSGEIETIPVEQRKRRPIPIFEDRFTQHNQYSREIPHIDLSKGYLKKDILAEIGNNLNELVNIKTGSINDTNQFYSKSVITPTVVVNR